LQAWHREGVKLAIYSSGSVAAQQLLMQYVKSSDAQQQKHDKDPVQTQDLRPLFEARYFDTVNAGPKTEKASYVKIAEALGLERNEFGEVVFFSDSVKG